MFRYEWKTTLGIDSFNFNNCNDYFVEMLIMDSYTNFASLPHILTITHRQTKHIIMKKKFNNENDAISYMNEAREFQNNKENFNFIISGPNMYYSIWCTHRESDSLFGYVQYFTYCNIYIILL